MTLRTISTCLLGATLTIFSTLATAGGDAEIGKAKSEELGCQACHGPDGNGVNPRVPQVPRLAGQYADYLAQALADYRTGKRQNAIMNGFAATLSADDRENIAAFYAAQAGVEVPNR